MFDFHFNRCIFFYKQFSSSLKFLLYSDTEIALMPAIKSPARQVALLAKKSSLPYMDAFLGYTLENSKSGVFLDVILSCGGGGMAIVNGVEMSSDNIVFYEIFREFLPEDVLENWKLHFETIEKLSR